MPRYAAIDIGSNSIRMEAAEIVPGQPIRTELVQRLAERRREANRQLLLEVRD
jgi:exopolyphosphatase/pppGpp-phosphohydrolase